MLKLKDIKKNYYVADMTVEALKGINLSFRKNEFVSILGPSGCGKTTLLNIIGGLDKYTSGDLLINGISTKEFTDKDWDVYRNHRIGFIFQSYNLIPHQTILGNVELALTIAGIGKNERIERAKKALDRVGLANQYYKKPNQLSGGQCQRVAIARALVNEPEILLADEPTGALDTETSVQIMELIKEIAKEKLVIMVTHNPDLAIKYSTRIVRFLDGKIVEDTMPFSSEDEEKEVEIIKNNVKDNKQEKAKMSLSTSFKLSLKNLLSKKNRTILTCFAGSIGIIGVSTVLAASTGVKTYIDSMQDDMLSGNPIKISQTSFDVSAVTSLMNTVDKFTFLKDVNEIGVDFTLEKILDKLNKSGDIAKNNKITKEYKDYIDSMPEEYRACILYNYGIDFSQSIFSEFTPLGMDTEMRSILSIKDSYVKVLSHVEEFGDQAEVIPSLITPIGVAPSNEKYISQQYNILSGRIATKKNEIMLVLDKDKNVSDLILAELGIYDQKSYVGKTMEMQNGLDDNGKFNYDKEVTFTYDDIMNHKFRWYSNNLLFNMNTSNDPMEQLKIAEYNYSESKITGNRTDRNSFDMEIVGIIQAKDDVNYGCLKSGFYVTEDLVKHSLEVNKNSLIAEKIKSILENPNPILSKIVTEKGVTSGITSTASGDSPFGIYYEYEYKYIDGETINDISTNAVKKYATVVESDSQSSLMSLIQNQMSSMMGGSTSLPQSSLQKSVGVTSLNSLGGNDTPTSISIYPINFVLKDNVTNYLDRWNSDEVITVNGVEIPKSVRDEITYTDSVGMIITMVNTLIDMITYALVAITSLALVVSCVMIAIITYVSVMERVKEIGVIRSLGGRKKDVSHLFNAETFIIGFLSGCVGIAGTYLLSLIANLILKPFIGMNLFNLPWYLALVMILISIVLTCISGLIPASSAAKKDPVVALRTE